MCEFISWIEKDGQVYYLTYRDIYHTRRGKELRDYCKSKDDLIGHGAIRFYYDNFVGGEDKECTDFSTPDNFPPEIVEDIKKGRMAGLDIFPTKLLLDKIIYRNKAYAEREKAYAEWKKADAERKKADAEREKAYAEWEKAYAKWKKADAEREKAYAEREKADAEWKKADAEWEKADNQKWGWMQFKIVKNRNKLWR